jgi:hypothetical protein
MKKQLFLTMLLACTGASFAVKADFATELTDKVSSLYKQRNELFETKNLSKKDLVERLQALHQEAQDTLATLPAKLNPEIHALKALEATGLVIASIIAIRAIGSQLMLLGLEQPQPLIVETSLSDIATDQNTINSTRYNQSDYAKRSRELNNREAKIDAYVAMVNGSLLCMSIGVITALYQSTRCVVDIIKVRTSTIEIQRSTLEKLISDLEDDVLKLNA